MRKTNAKPKLKMKCCSLSCKIYQTKLSCQTGFKKRAPTYRGQVVNPKHQTPQSNTCNPIFKENDHRLKHAVGYVVRKAELPSFRTPAYVVHNEWNRHGNHDNIHNHTDEIALDLEISGRNTYIMIN